MVQKAILLVCALIVAGALSQSVTRPNRICSPATTNAPDEGFFQDLTSTAPAGYRVGIHAFSYQCEDTATYSSEYYFKAGSSDGFEETRWPWVLHFSETFGCSSFAIHTYNPLPVVLGEVPVGYLMMADDVHDLLFSTTNNDTPYGDAFLTVSPITSLDNPPAFSAGSTTDFFDTAVVCFTYTLDQFGALARVDNGYTIHGFDQKSVSLLAPRAGVYNVLSHQSLSLSVSLSHSPRGGHRMDEAGICLADGHRLRLALDGSEGPLVEVTLPNGEVQRIVLDQSVASSLHALPLEFVDDEEAAIKTQVFVSSFSTREACLQDPMINRYYELGDLEELDAEEMLATARVTTVTEAFEVTLVVLQSEALDDAGTIKVLSHKRVAHGSSVGDTSSVTSAPQASFGLLGVTASSTGTAKVEAERYLMKEASVLATKFEGSLFN